MRISRRGQQQFNALQEETWQMRNRITGAMVAMAIAAAVSLTVMPLAGQAGRGQAPAGGAAPAPAGQGRGAAPAQPAGRGTAAPRPDRIAGKPNFNGVWQAMGTAYWNLEDHSASDLKQFWQLGAIAAIPAGQSVVEGGTIRSEEHTSELQSQSNL